MKKILLKKPEFFHNINYEIKGFNIEKSFNNLTKINIKLKNIKKRQENITEFSSEYKNDKKITEYLKNNNIEIISKKNYGFLFYLKSFFKRFGLISALFIFTVFSVVMQNFVLKIEVLGNEKISKEEIVCALGELGITKFSPVQKIDKKELESALAKSLKNVSMISVITKGSSLVINIQEKVINDEYQNVGNFKPLIASASGRIKSVKLVQGTLVCKVGDIVKEGDTLVEPYIIDASGEKRSVKAEAEIVAEIWFEGRVTHAEKFLETKKTGKTMRKKNIFFLGLPLYVDKSQIEFAEYEVAVTKENLSTTLLPIKIENILVEETMTEEKFVPFSEVEEECLLRAKEFAKEKAQEKSVIQEYHTVNGEAGIYFVSYVLVAEGNIASPQ